MSDPKAKPQDAKHEEAAKPAASTPKALLAVVALNFLVSAGVGAFLLLRPAPAPVAAAPAHDTKKDSGGGHGASEEKKEEGGGHGEAKKEEGGHGEAKEGAKADGGEAGPTGATARLEDIIVHLRNPEVDRYARLTLDVEMSTASELAGLQPRTPQIRDAVITALSEETYESLRGAEGLSMMKEKVRQRIDDVVPGTVRAVYVSGFIVQ